MKYSFILPCKNEEEALPYCVLKIKKTMRNLKEKDYEILIVNNNSTDNSSEIAKKLGVKIIKEKKTGYGKSCRAGFKKAKGNIIILGDADDSYDFKETPKLLEHTKDHDLILGKRTHLHKGSMPFLNRYIGNPILSSLLRTFHKTKIKDTHTGFRVIKKKALRKLNLKTTGMEFASEMIIESLKNNLKIKETPISYHPRKGKTKLKRFSDGWRHIKFILRSSKK
jgi:glycosyltransferase involved in cell wall biosynthesis